MRRLDTSHLVLAAVACLIFAMCLIEAVFDLHEPATERLNREVREIRGRVAALEESDE